MTDTNTSGAKCAHNWHDSSEKPGTVWCNRCGMVSAAGSEGVPIVETSGADVLAIIDKTERYFAFSDDPAVDLRNARTAVAALIEREAALVDGMRELLAERNHRIDGSAAELLERCRHLSRGDRDLIAMRGRMIDDLKAERDALAADFPGIFDARRDRRAGDQP